MLDAIDEYEDLGAEEFLSRYGAGLVKSMTIEYVGRQFAALPTLSVAHRFLHGSLLTATDLAEPIAAQRLEALGFRVNGAPASTRARAGGASAGRARPASARSARPAMPAVSREPVSQIRRLGWPFEKGDQRTRQELVTGIGASKHSTIDVSARTSSVIVFSHPGGAAGLVGWTPDGGAYRAIGEGRRGDQSWGEVNQALLHHAEAGLTVRLFEEVEEPWRPGGRRYTYLGEFGVDPGAPWQSEQAPDTDEKDRAVLVFRLVPLPGDGEGVPSDGGTLTAG